MDLLSFGRAEREEKQSEATTGVLSRYPGKEPSPLQFDESVLAR
jgi:hypothetical protein